VIQAVDAYLALRRTAGFELTNARYLLRSFARFAAERHETHIRTTTAIEWASRSGSIAQRDERLKTVCRFARHLHADDLGHDVPPGDHFGFRKSRRVPHIYSPSEIDRLIAAALELGPPDTLKPQTYATLIALLAATGLRISEALALACSDVTPTGLLIPNTKFHKTRLVPLHDTAVAGLQRYLRRRRRTSVRAEAVFVDDAGRPLRYQRVHSTFRKLVNTAGIVPSGRRPTRLHELRHTFAVRALEASPAGRQRVGQHMLALATYMGHVNISATYWYLETTAELLRDIATAGETFLHGEPA